MTAGAGRNPAERADAARNRAKILASAAQIVAAEGPGGLAPDVVAREAGVGVGTVYRRFRDRAELVFALLEEQGRAFQEALETGPPPLGPGAPPAERLRAFLHALVDLVEEHLDLLLVAEASSPAARYRSRAYLVQQAHLELLLGQLRPAAGLAFLTDALLAPLTPSLVAHQRRERGMTAAALKAGLDDLVTAMVQAPSGAR
jgi:AcrR family transcriptional regulator